MRPKKSATNRAFKLLSLILVTVLIALVAVSCSSGESEEAQSAEDSVKLPPGVTMESLEEESSSGNVVEVQDVDEESEAEEEQEAEAQEEEEQSTEDETSSQGTSGSGINAYFDGIYITVLSAARQDSNELVYTSGSREVMGDYLQIELFMENVGEELIDLADYSFRIWNPAIDADIYKDYYGNDGTYGGYVSENIISATLLDYATLQPVNYKLKIGETVVDVFLFLDLNPCSTSLNQGFLLESTNLIIHNNDSGEEVEINMAPLAG